MCCTQATAIIEREHQTIANIIRTFDLTYTVIEEENPWSGILAPMMFAIRSTVHTTSEHTPM